MDWKPKYKPMTKVTEVDKGNYLCLVNGKVVKTYEADSVTGASEVKHIKMYNPLDDFYGMSPIKAASVKA